MSCEREHSRSVAGVYLPENHISTRNDRYAYAALAHHWPRHTRINSNEFLFRLITLSAFAYVCIAQVSDKRLCRRKAADRSLRRHRRRRRCDVYVFNLISTSFVWCYVIIRCLVIFGLSVSTSTRRIVVRTTGPATFVNARQLLISSLGRCDARMRWGRVEYGEIMLAILRDSASGHSVFFSFSFFCCFPRRTQMKCKTFFRFISASMRRAFHE